MFHILGLKILVAQFYVMLPHVVQNTQVNTLLTLVICVFVYL